MEFENDDADVELQIIVDILRCNAGTYSLFTVRSVQLYGVVSNEVYAYVFVRVKYVRSQRRSLGKCWARASSAFVRSVDLARQPEHHM